MHAGPCALLKALHSRLPVLKSSANTRESLQCSDCVLSTHGGARQCRLWTERRTVELDTEAAVHLRLALVIDPRNLHTAM